MTKRISGASVITLRIYIIVLFFAAFIPFLNPARLSGLVSANDSLFTSAVSYSSIGSNFVRALNNGWVGQSTLTITYLGAVVTILAIAAFAASACLSMGKLKMRVLGAKVAVLSAVVGFAGASVLLIARYMLGNSYSVGHLNPLPFTNIFVFYGIFAVALVLALVSWRLLPKPAADDRYEMAPKFRLLLMILPFLILVALFSYLPLWGWRYAFYDYSAGFSLSWDNFVGFKWFTYLFQNEATRADVGRVLVNTLALSGIGIATSWLPMLFAIFLSEIKASKPRRWIQTLTTIPNFISWILVYSVAFAIFSSEGFVNWMLVNLHIIKEGSNYLMDANHIWIKMWLWGTWKGLGWSAIIYLASISGIDPQLYEAATVDGAGRFRRMWHVTIPGLTSTFFVLLLLSIANVLSNGLEQYLAFYNPANRSSIQVLDLYIYQLGLGAGTSQTVPLATVIGMAKSVISVTLLFGANKLSKIIRGESIV